MSKKNVIERKRVTFRGGADVRNLVMFRYGVLGSKHKAKGYCEYHSCFISGKDLSEKHCNHKHCKHFQEHIECYG